jgi:hypothetical protein
MDPVSLAVVSIGSTLIGGGVSAMGAAYQGQAQANAYNYQAGVAAMNQQIARQNADYSIKTGEIQAQQEGMKTKARVGGIIAQQGASNLDVNSGSAREVADSAEKLGQYGEGVIRTDAAKRAYGYEVEATNLGAQSQLYRTAATTSQTAADYRVAGTLLGTSTSVADKWYKMSTDFPSFNAGFS